VAEAELERAAPLEFAQTTLASPLAVRSSGIGGHDTMSGEMRPCCWPVPSKCNPILCLRTIEIRALC
jgi:hypothetical protein